MKEGFVEYEYESEYECDERRQGEPLALSNRRSAPIDEIKAGAGGC